MTLTPLQKWMVKHPEVKAIAGIVILVLALITAIVVASDIGNEMEDEECALVTSSQK